MSKTNVWNHRGLRALLVAVIVAMTGWAVWQFVELVGRNGVGVLSPPCPQVHSDPSADMHAAFPKAAAIQRTGAFAPSPPITLGISC